MSILYIANLQQQAFIPYTSACIHENEYYMHVCFCVTCRQKFEKIVYLLFFEMNLDWYVVLQTASII